MARYRIWDEMRRMQREMDRLFSDFFSYSPDLGYFDSYDIPLLEDNNARRKGNVVKSNYRQPLSDIWETDKEIVATVELPGVDKDSIEVNAKDNGVEIKVEKKDEHKEEDKKKGIYRLERSYSGFYRFFSMPESADLDNIKASYKNGVLELRVPKKETEDKSRRIKVD